METAVTPNVFVYLKTVGLLIASNLFMTFAWYGHLKNMSGKPWIIAALVSWGIALFEYLIQVPANRIGYAGGITLAQLKITQEVITLSLFVPFSMLYMGEKFRWDFVWAGLCLVGAVYFMFRK
ncbi:MAG: DMT family protein [Lentisphaeria bacterium]|nr:DMT family protein [Lentisphaeria bacterium]